MDYQEFLKMTYGNSMDDESQTMQLFSAKLYSGLRAVTGNNAPLICLRSGRWTLQQSLLFGEQILRKPI